MAGSVVGTIGSFEWDDAPSGNAEWYHLFLNRNGSKYLSKWYRRSEVLDGGELELDYNLPAGSYNWWLRGWSTDAGMGPWAGSPFTVSP